jgi:hypothetical protein
LLNNTIDVSGAPLSECSHRSSGEDCWPITPRCSLPPPGAPPPIKTLLLPKSQKGFLIDRAQYDLDHSDLLDNLSIGIPAFNFHTNIINGK